MGIREEPEAPTKLDYESEGRRFESCRARPYSPCKWGVSLWCGTGTDRRLTVYRRLIRAEKEVRHEPRRLLLHLVWGLSINVHCCLDIGVPEPTRGVARADLEQDEKGGSTSTEVLEALLSGKAGARAMMGFRERERTLSPDCGMPTVVEKTIRAHATRARRGASP